MTAKKHLFLMPIVFAILSTMTVPRTAQAGPFSLKKGRAAAARAGEKYLLCIVSAELTDKKKIRGLEIPAEVIKVLPDAANGLPWDITVGPISEDIDEKKIAMTAVKLAVKSTIGGVVGGDVIGKVAELAVGQIPTGPDDEELPDVFAELRLGRTLMLRTPKIGATTTPVWNHCAEFKRTHLVGHTPEIKVMDHDQIRIDPRELGRKPKQRGDVAGVVVGATISTAMLDKIANGDVYEETLEVTEQGGLRRVVWRIEPSAQPSTRDLR